MAVKMTVDDVLLQVVVMVVAAVKKNDGREGGDGCGKRLSIYCYFHY